MRHRTLQGQIIKYGVVVLALSALYFLRDTESAETPENRVQRALLEEEHDDDTKKACDHPSKQTCRFLQENCPPDGYIDYINLYYCTRPPKWLTFVLFLCWLVVLFYILGVSADDYFCPTLEVISETLHMGPELAGLTLLALGNGAPDVSTTIIAINGATDSFGTSIGELLGAGVFVTTMVVGAVAIVSLADLDRLNFLRDIVFYVVGVGAIVIIVWDKKIYLLESVAFLLYYFAYVGFAASLNYCPCFGKKEDEDKDAGPDYTAVPTNDSLNTELEDVEKMGEDTEPEAFSWVGFKKDWGKKTLFGKVVFAFSFPFVVWLTITIPNTERWNRYAVTLVPMTMPMLVFIALNDFSPSIHMGSVDFPVWALCLIVGSLVSVVVFLTTKTYTKPIYYGVFVVLAFVNCILWIFVVSSEVVALLTSLGHILKISDIILGATVLAWGNSIGDFVADVLMAKRGLPKMAIAAAYGGPLFNLLFGLGVGMTWKTASIFPKHYHVNVPSLNEFYCSAFFLGGSLLGSCAVISINKFFIPKKWAIVLVVWYLLYTLFLILLEFKVIFPDKR